MRKYAGFIGLYLYLTGSVLAQSFQLDPVLPVQKLDTSTALTVLNGRMGSRFSLSFSASEQSMNTGALGYDADELRDMMIGLEYGGQTYAFRTGTLPHSVRPLRDQELRLGMTATQLSGKLPDGAQVHATLVSPFTPSEDWDDTSRIKVQIAPLYYILLDFQPSASTKVKEDSVSLFLGFRAIPYDVNRDLNLSNWRRYGGTPLFWKDGNAGEAALLRLDYLEKELPFRQIGGYACHELKVPHKEHSEPYTFLYSTWYDGEVMYHKGLNQSLRFYYTQFFPNPESLVQFGKTKAKENLDKSQKFEQILTRSQTSPETKWVTANAFHTDLANTFLLQDEEGNPSFYVMEGRFRHLNTIDVAHETELQAVFAPWRLQMQLHQWEQYLALHDITVRGYNPYKQKFFDRREGFSASEYGPYLYHDVGDYPFVDEYTNYNFGPYMAVEENTNFTLLLYWYWKLSGDDRFVQQRLGLVNVLMQSLINRDMDGTGLADQAVGWSTYDVSEAIKRSTENVYLGIKQLVAYEAAATMMEELAITGSKRTAAESESEGIDGDLSEDQFANLRFPNQKLRKQQAATYHSEAKKILSTLEGVDQKMGYLPVSLNKSFEGWDQYSILLGEGLFLPGLSGLQSKTMKKAAKLTESTFEQAVPKSKESYGIRLSSGEPVTWFSKVMVADVIAAYWYGKQQGWARYPYEWNKNNSQAYQDGAYSESKPWLGNWYPRGISVLGYLFYERKFTASDRINFVEDLR